MPELTIKNATIVNEGSLSEKDLFVKDGRIEKIEDSLEVRGEFIDATGLHLSLIHI